MGLIQSRSYDEVEVRDISLTDYINIRSPVYIPHSAGRYAVKRFRKAQVRTWNAGGPGTDFLSAQSSSDLPAR
jgi:hypothetical protein